MTAPASVCSACDTPLPEDSHFCPKCGAATPTEPGVPPRTMATGAVEVATVRTALADRYRIERVLGEGGMATVYLADDLKHHRKVAVKVMRPELAATLGVDRFLREIEIAAQLSHPHILPVYDSGSAGSVLYYVMPYVQGESLRERLQREGRLPVDEALQLAREVAEALGYAHRQGIIHRDIKPANVMLSEGHALVADFGIARAAGGGPVLTQTGLAVGTPQYMSPEQAGGERDIDARADVYAIGAMLYEMLAGQPPYTGATPQAVFAKSLTEEMTPLSVACPGVPVAVVGVVAKATARRPADRYASGTDLEQALAAARDAVRSGASPAAGVGVARGTVGGLFSAGRWFVRGGPARRWGVAAVLLLAVAASALVLRGGRGGASPGGGIRLAVLPFANRGDPADAYVVDGFADEIRGKLAGLAGFAVTGRTSSEQYRQTTKSAADIGRDLGVRYLLSATVSWERNPRGNGRVRLVPELVDARTGEVTWQRSFDAALTDVFQVQADVAVRVAEALNVALAPSERREIAAPLTANLAAYEAFLRGEELRRSSNIYALRSAVGFYERAVALDSTFALAWAALSQAQSSIAYSFFVVEAPAAALRAAQRARALAPAAPESYVAMGKYYGNVRYDYQRARQEYAEALRHAPGNLDALDGAARAERALGRWEAAVALLQRAQSLDRRNVGVLRALAQDLLWLRRHGEALAALEGGLTIASADVALLQLKAMVYLAQGDLAAAQAVLRTALAQAEPTSTLAYFASMWGVDWMLDDEQQRLVLRLPPEAFGDDRGSWAQTVAATYALRGDAARARAYGDTAAAASSEQARGAPDDAFLLANGSLSLAYAGRRADALRNAERSVAVQPLAVDAFSVPFNWYAVARAYAVLGEQDKAIDRLEELLRVPFFVTPAWLRIDRGLAALRGNPRFQRLIAGR